MLLQWTLLQLASLGIDDGNKNCTGLVPNLTPLIGANPLIRPPALLSQLLLPNTPAEVTPAPQVRCQNHTSEATPAPALSRTTTSVSDTRNTSKAEANIPTVTTQPVTTTTPSNDGSKLVPQGGHADTPEVTTEPALNTAPASVEEPTTPTPTVTTTVTSTNGKASVLPTDDGITPENTTPAPATIPASETTPKPVKEDGMKITKQTAESTTKQPDQPSEDTSQQNEEFYAMQQLLETSTSQSTSPVLTPVTHRSSDASMETETDISVTNRADIGTEVTTPPPTDTTAVPELPLMTLSLPTSPSEVQVDVSGDSQATAPAEAVGISGKDTLISEPAIGPGLSSLPVGVTSHVMSGGNVPGLTQQEIWGLTPGSGTDISAAANGHVLTPAVVAVPHILTTANTGPLMHQGTLGLKPESGTVITGSETLPEYSTGVVGLPSHLSAANIATLLPQGIHGLTPGSAHIGNSVHSQTQPAVPLEQVLAPIISALLVKEWQEHPQYRFGRSVNRFEPDENSKTSIKEQPQRLPDPHTRYRRAGQLLTRYQIVKSVIDKFMEMRPKTQDFLVKQGVKLTAKKVGEMLKSYGPEMKDWINGKLSSMNVDPSSYTVGDEMDNLVRNIADSLENYIETLPH